MASASTRKQCANDDGCKQGAVTNCEGCSKAFCIKHFNGHRRLLDEEMNMIIDEHDHLKNTLNQQTTKLDSHPLVKEIDHWEKESIEKIQKRANELRQELLRSTTTHTDDVAKKLQQLSEKLKRGREQDDYIETDLQLWKKALNNLKTNLTSPSTISINRRDNVSLVQNISIDLLTKTKEEFERVSDNRIRIEKNGQVATHDRSQYATEVRGKNEYRSERHEIRLCIEQLDGDWIFLGVNSKSAPVHNLSHGLQSAYGWSSNNKIWLSGACKANHTNSLIEMKTNDVIILIFDCDNHKISLINQRTLAKHSLSVNINNCPFPWQLHVNLFGPNNRVRIL